MATVSDEIRSYVSEFERKASEVFSREPSPLLDLRRAAIAQFEARGFPTVKHEEWKYTNVAPIVRSKFQLSSNGTNGDRSRLVLPFCTSDDSRIVFINGRFSSELSTLDTFPAGIEVSSLANVLKSRFSELEPHLARYASFDDRVFVALNTAFMEDGAFIHIVKNVILERPLHIVFVTTSDKPIVLHPRNLVVLGENSAATILETYWGPEGGVYFTNTVTEIVASENAVLDHYKIQTESESAYHIATTQIHQDRSSNFTSHSISLGGALVRNDTNVVLDGEGIESTINGLYAVAGKQHVDNHTMIDHAKPHCNSHELYKGILDGGSTGVFNGKVFVRQDAQKTDAKQTNQNLLLSKEATINTKPQLEIFADDVRCTHGATIGQLDEDAIFYLRSRGIGNDEARSLLTYAFASDVLRRIKVPTLRRELENRLFARLPGRTHALRDLENV